MPARPVATTRRTALAATVGLAGLAAGGCTSDSPASDDDPGQVASTSAPPVDADQDLVDDVVARLTTALSAVTTAGGTSEALAQELAGLRSLHLAHLDALGGDGTSSADASTGSSRREVLRVEDRLQRFLATAAVGAESGTLAKLLASMSAAVAQQLAVLR